MNIKNNKRRQQSREKIETVFTQLLQSRELSQITVSDICKLTQLNRSTFYANYQDIYDLAEQLRKKLEQEVRALYGNNVPNSFSNDDYLRLLYHIKENQLFYQTYFKLGYDKVNIFDLSELDPDNHFFPKEHLEYHIEFHRAGLNAMIKKWMQNGCVESPEEMAEILRSEYRGRA